MAEPEIIEEWLKRAGEDFEFDSSNLKDRNQFFGQICFHCLLWKPRALHGFAKGNISTFVLPLFHGLWPQKQSHLFHGW